MDSKREIWRLLREHRAELVRHNRHKVYKLPNGALFVTGETETSYRGWRDRLAQLRKLLGIKRPVKRAVPGEHKSLAMKNRNTKQPAFVPFQTSSALPSLAGELRKLFPNLVTRTRRNAGQFTTTDR
jgi:hypothetical protein